MTNGKEEAGAKPGQTPTEMAYEVKKKNESGSVVEVTVTGGKYTGKSATIAQISSLCAYYNIMKE